MRKAAGDETMEDESVSQNQNTKVQKLVTADGTYATQSAFDAGKTSGDSGSKVEKVNIPILQYNRQAGLNNNAVFHLILSVNFLSPKNSLNGLELKQNPNKIFIYQRHTSIKRA